MSEHSKTNTKSIAHSRLKKRIQAHKRKKYAAIFGTCVGGVFVVLVATLHIRSILDKRSHIRLKVFVDSSGVTGVLNVPKFPPIIFLADSVSATRNISKELSFYEKKIDTVFLLGTKESNITFFNFARSAYIVAAVVRSAFISEKLTATLHDVPAEKMLAKMGSRYERGVVQVIPLFIGMPSTKSDTRRSNMAMLVCVETCILFSPNISDHVVRKIMKEKVIRSKIDYVISGSVRTSSKSLQKKSPRLELLQSFASSLGGATLADGVGEFEFEYSLPPSQWSRSSDRKDDTRAPGAGWHIKQKSPFEL